MPETPTEAPSRVALQLGLFVGILAAAIEGMAVTTAMPAAAEQLGRIEWYAWAFSLFMLGTLTATVLSGRLADRVGPLRPFVGGQIVFAVGLMIGGVASSMELLLAGRLIQGLGAGSMIVALYVITAHAFDERRRAAVMTLVSAAWVLPSFFGPPAAAWVTTTFSWHWVFFGAVPMVVLSTVLTLPVLLKLDREGVLEAGPSTETDPMPWWSGLALAIGASGLQYAGQRFGDNLRDLVTALIAVASLALVIAVLPRMMPPGFTRLGEGLPAVMVTRMLVAGAFFAGEFFIPLMLVQSRQLTLGQAGWVLTVGSLGWFAGSWLQARPWVRLRRDQMITFGTLAVALGLAGPAFVALLPGLWIWWAIIVWAFAGLGMGFAIASTSLATMTLSDRAHQGRNNAALQAAESLGNSVISGVAGTIFVTLRVTGDLNLTFGVVLLAAVLVALLAHLAAWRIGVIHAEA